MSQNSDGQSPELRLVVKDLHVHVHEESCEVCRVLGCTTLPETCLACFVRAHPTMVGISLVRDK